MILRRLFQRGASRPPSLAEGLLAPLAEAGLPAVVVAGDAPERAAGLRAHVADRGLVRISEGGPPDFVRVTSEGGGDGHFVRSAAVGFHFLVRREGRPGSIAADWGMPGKVVAQREFGGLGSAHDFHWQATMEDSDVAAPQAVAAADELNALRQFREPILALLQAPKTLVLEIAPAVFGADGEAALIRASVFFGGREAIGAAEVELMRSICRALADAGAPPGG
jgi:hypothetical protein